MYSNEKLSLDCSWSQNYGKYSKLFEYFWYSNNYSNSLKNYEYIRYSYSCHFHFTNIFGIRIRPKINIRCNTGLGRWSRCSTPSLDTQYYQSLTLRETPRSHAMSSWPPWTSLILTSRWRSWQGFTKVWDTLPGEWWIKCSRTPVLIIKIWMIWWINFIKCVQRV